MDEIENRLRTAADACIGKYGEWRANRHDGGTRESLQDAIHELRKVSSRLEVELAISEREELAQRPIPIPPHRAARERPQQSSGQVEDDFVGNRASPDSHGGISVSSRLQRRRRPPQDSAQPSSPPPSGEPQE